ALEELGEWATARARAWPRGGIRTLVHAADGSITYDLGVAAADPTAAQLVMIDSEMRRVPACDCALLELG
ncbi:MAG: hypothetical protein NT062_24270, partial [Proteobacteria bacterium]|nr:hypothetical protein [Pseudomonadota bacterium]